jgi:hypothetical protein
MKSKVQHMSCMSKTEGVRRSLRKIRFIIYNDYNARILEFEFDIRLKGDHILFSQSISEED